MNSIQQQDNNINTLLPDYKRTFVNTFDRHIEKENGKSWIYVNEWITDNDLIHHIKGIRSIGTYAKLYPTFVLFDYDDVHIQTVIATQNTLCPDMQPNQRLILQSESPNSYHVLMKPKRNGSPVHVETLHKILDPHVKVYGHFLLKKIVEVYPSETHGVRIPFSPLHKLVKEYGNKIEIVDIDFCRDFSHFLYEIQEYDISQITQNKPSKNREMLAAHKPKITNNKNDLIADKYSEYDYKPNGEWYAIAKQVISEGYTRGERHHQTFHLAFFCFMQCLTEQNTLKHLNDLVTKYAHTYNDSVRTAQRENASIVRFIYNKYVGRIYPQDVTVMQYGFLNKTQVTELVVITQGNLPLLKFCIYLFMYLEPRALARIQRVGYVDVHSDKLIQWSNGRTRLKQSADPDEKIPRAYYLKHIANAERHGLIKRWTHYEIGKESKSIQILPNWTIYNEVDKAVKTPDGLLPTNPKEMLTSAFERQELYALLKQTTPLSTENIIMKLRLIF